MHKELKTLRDKHGLTWMRISMSYHRFPNLRDIFQSALTAKMIENVVSLDFQSKPCNCKAPKGQCNYGKVCREPVVIYKVKCELTNKFYIGNTQQFFKNRMRGHFQDVKQYVEKNVLSDSYARHSEGLVPKGAKSPTPGEQRVQISCSLIWKGNPLSAVKTFGKNSCKLCNREQMAIVKAEHNNPNNLINSRSELHGACRHLPRFHRLLLETKPSADEHTKREKVDQESPARMTRRKPNPSIL
jgi:hypothetical protein